MSTCTGYIYQIFIYNTPIVRLYQIFAHRTPHSSPPNPSTDQSLNQPIATPPLSPLRPQRLDHRTQQIPPSHSISSSLRYGTSSQSAFVGRGTGMRTDPPAFHITLGSIAVVPRILPMVVEFRRFVAAVSACGGEET